MNGRHDFKAFSKKEKLRVQVLSHDTYHKKPRNSIHKHVRQGGGFFCDITKHIMH